MLVCLKPKNFSTNQNEPGGVWINTDHIVEVREIRSRPMDDEPLALRLVMVNGNQHPVDVNNAGRGTAERLLEWLKHQDKLGSDVKPPEKK